MKALVGAFNQEKALVGAFSVIVKTGCGTDGSLHSTIGVTIADDGGHVYRGLADGVEPRAELVQRRRVREAELLSQQGRGVLH